MSLGDGSLPWVDYASPHVSAADVMSNNCVFSSCKRARYDGGSKADTLAGPGSEVDDVAEAPAAPPAMTSYRHDPMWADLGIPVLTEQEMREDEVRRRIEVSRNVAILRGAGQTSGRRRSAAA